MKPMVPVHEVRQALADYIASEGCSCCCNVKPHDEAKVRLAKLLHVPKYRDGSGYDFYRFTTEFTRKETT